MQTSSSSFTVEQVELIRRIRNSGVTCQQIIEAFQALDRIDAELGPIYSMPVSAALANKNGPHTGVRHLPTVSLGSGERTSASVVTQNLTTSNSVRNCSPISVSANSPAFRSTPLTISGPTGQAGVTPLMGNVTAGRGISKFSDTLRDVAQAAMGKAAAGLGPTYQGFPSVNTADMATPERPAIKLDVQAGNSGNATGSSGLTGHSDSMKIEPSELTFDRCYNILLSQSQETLNMLVQKFLMLVPDNTLHKQAVDLGVSEAAMGQFMGGDWTSLDAGIKHKLLEWFISQLRHTDWFLDDLTQLLRVQGMEHSEGLDVHFVPRRERFTFKEKHLEVLEVFFKKGQYPTQEEKEHIANECNIAMAMETDRELLDREKMTHVNVTNWFSNRRKEIKRLAKKGGIETERVILPSRVKTKNPGHHLPTYDELAEEQLAKQKTLGLSPGFLNFGGSHTSFSWKSELDAGHSLDGSSFSNITNTSINSNHQNFSSVSSSSQDSSLLHGPNNHHDISNHLSTPLNQLDTPQNHLETLQNHPHPLHNDAGIVFPPRSTPLGLGEPKTDQSSDHPNPNPNPFTTVSGVNIKLEPADT